MENTQYGICVKDCYVYFHRDPRDQQYLRQGTIVQVIDPDNSEVSTINIFHIDYVKKCISIIDKLYFCEQKFLKIVPVKLFRFLVSVPSLGDRLNMLVNSHIICNLKKYTVIELEKSFFKYFKNIICQITYIGEVQEMGVGDFVGVKFMSCNVPLMSSNEQTKFASNYFNDTTDSLLIPITDLINFYVKEIRPQTATNSSSNVVQTSRHKTIFTCSKCKTTDNIIHLQNCNHKLCKDCVIDKFKSGQALELSCNYKMSQENPCSAIIKLEFFIFMYRDIEVIFNQIRENNRKVCYNCAVKSDDNGNVVQISDCNHSICTKCVKTLLKESPPKDYCMAINDDNDKLCKIQLNEKYLNNFMSPNEMDEYRERKISHILETTENSFRCKTPKCYFYWVNTDKTYTKFYCKLCRIYNCLKCDAIHNGSCKEYERQILNGTDENKKEKLRARLTSDELAEHELVLKGRVDNYAQAENFCILRKRNPAYEEADLIWAIKENDDINFIERSLNVECCLCIMTFAHNKIFSMMTCEHVFCNNCAKAYFTTQITEKTIRDCVCPICNMPEFDDDSTEAEYFQLLDAVLKNILEQKVYDVFGRKTRDRALARLPNFKWCVKCDYGFEVNRNMVHAACPTCATIFCISCNEIWQEQHAGITCAQFKQWKQENDPNTQATGVAKYLEENGIVCPSPTCNFKYSLAKGGCLHFTCTQCKHEFCFGCRQPFLRGAQCKKYKDCATKGIHAHHPRNCISILRDCSIASLENLIKKAKIDFNGIPPNGTTCQIPIQKETPNGFVDVLCEQATHNANTGLCDQHYQEGIIDVIFKAKLDPVDILDLGECQGELIRNNVALPQRLATDTDATFREKCIVIIKQSLPIV